MVKRIKRNFTMENANLVNNHIINIVLYLTLKLKELRETFPRSLSPSDNDTNKRKWEQYHSEQMRHNREVARQKMLHEKKKNNF